MPASQPSITIAAVLRFKPHRSHKLPCAATAASSATVVVSLLRRLFLTFKNLYGGDLLPVFIAEAVMMMTLRKKERSCVARVV
uniref:Uncharacterized protein n=1 Tax=Cannabis sativa TaxID=3483 RepID=A0A803PM11_CANSA